MRNSIKFHDITITFEPLVIFERISLCKSNNDDPADYLQSELAPYALSLFNDCGMFKAEKSTLYQIFEQSNEIIDLEQQTIVFHGGFLSHKMVRKKGSTIQDICKTDI